MSLAQVLDRLLSGWDVTSPQSATSLESCLAEIEDLLSYCNDVLATGGIMGRDLKRTLRWVGEIRIGGLLSFFL